MLTISAILFHLSLDNIDFPLPLPLLHISNYHFYLSNEKTVINFNTMSIDAVLIHTLRTHTRLRAQGHAHTCPPWLWFMWNANCI